MPDSHSVQTPARNGETIPAVEQKIQCSSGQNAPDQSAKSAGGDFVHSMMLSIQNLSKLCPLVLSGGAWLWESSQTSGFCSLN